MVSTVCILMPGDMGHGVGTVLRKHGYRTITALDGRSSRSRKLAEICKAEDLGNLNAVTSQADIILSILPPGAAIDQARAVASAMTDTGKSPVYVDCNAISPATTITIGEIIGDTGATYIDAGIIGIAPDKSSGTRFYVSGPDTGAIKSFDGKGFSVIDLGQEIGKASAMKMAYAGLTKGSWTLWTSILLTAERNGLLNELIAEFEHSQSPTLQNMRRMVPALPADSDRWIGEMEEIAKTFREAGVTGDFHDGAAWIFKLLSETPLASETRETMDRSRSLETSLGAYAKALADRKPRI